MPDQLPHCVLRVTPPSTSRRALFVLATLAACGGGGGGDADGDGGTAPPVRTRFEGVLTSGVERGRLVLESGSPASGSLTLGENAPVTLSGTSTGGRFELAGGGYTVSATPQGAEALQGTVTGGALTAAANFGALTVPDTGMTVRYCGVYTGGDAGMGDVLVRGSRAVASVTGMGGGFSMTGTATATSVNLTFTGREPGTNREATITANLTRTGDTLTGPASNTLYPSNVVTTVVATRAGCQATSPSTLGLPFIVDGVATKPTFMARMQLYIVNGADPMHAVDTRYSNARSITDPALLQGFMPYGSFNRTTGAFWSWHSGAGHLQATLNGVQVSGSVNAAGTGVLASRFDKTVFEGLARTTLEAPGPYCGSFTGPDGNAEIFVTYSGTVAMAKIRYERGQMRLLTGSFSPMWIYLTDGTKFFMAANRTSATTTTQTFTGTWSSDDPAIGAWQVRTCP